jgi:hypothetical protein
LRFIVQGSEKKHAVQHSNQEQFFRSNEKQFQGGLISRARRRSLKSRPRVIKKKKHACLATVNSARERGIDTPTPTFLQSQFVNFQYTGTSPMRKRPPPKDPPKTLGIGLRWVLGGCGFFSLRARQGHRHHCHVPAKSIRQLCAQQWLK